MVRQGTSGWGNSFSEGSPDLGSQSCAQGQSSAPEHTPKGGEWGSGRHSREGHCSIGQASHWDGCLCCHEGISQNEVGRNLITGENESMHPRDRFPPSICLGKTKSRRSNCSVGPGCKYRTSGSWEDQLLQGSRQGRVCCWSDCGSYSFQKNCSQAPASACAVVWIRRVPWPHRFTYFNA